MQIRIAFNENIHLKLDKYIFCTNYNFNKYYKKVKEHYFLINRV